ncbi:iron-siderophore ABC transporter substrate-binding protein [Microcoleus sp. FACHB-1515]|uniref:ABC transporter substrate-binding protein n=1 Tax=Cyanophyceae TaxID=3028117 RepID=UPI001683C95E|nr:iron-siderophore ABC transporter substrate-binding protein [Microcoleus sp. FACHB-1515]MBD2091494.1 iron-siderophore ABC transporter substrate-binding protein [Microcoleus sp. FACHB-1515]
MADRSGDCRVIQHEMGETTVCGQPQRIVALDPHILDSILALGVQPIAYAESRLLDFEQFNLPAEQIPYLGDRITTKPLNLGDRRNPSIERILQVKPDLILGERWLHEGHYDRYSKIAPTLLFSDIGENSEQHWKNDIKEIAKAVNRESEAQQLLEKFPQKIATVRNKLASVVAAYPHVLVASWDSLTSTISIGPTSAGRLLEAIGFELVNTSTTNFGEWVSLSIEVLPEINADLIFVMGTTPEFYNPEAQLRSKWKDQPLLASLPSSQAGRIFFVDQHLWISQIRGPITDELILEQIFQLLLPLTDRQESKV